MKEKKKNIKVEAERKPKIAKAISSRGRKFNGRVIKKFVQGKRIVVEFERMIYIRKYERYAKAKTRIHARLPEKLIEKIKIGDYVEIGECRPLSKIIHAVVLKKVSKEEI